MLGTLRRWFNLRTDAREVAGDDAAVSDAATPPDAARVPNPATESTPVHGRLIARQPLLDRAGRVAGWELRFSDWARSRLAAGASGALGETYGFALAAAARATVQSGRAALLVCGPLPAPQFVSEHDLPSDAIVATGATEAAEVAGDCRTASAWAGGGSPPAGDYILLDAEGLGIDAALDAVARLSAQGRRCIVLNLVSVDDVTRVLQCPVSYASGRFALGASAGNRRAAPAGAIAAARLLTAVIRGESPQRIADKLKVDVALSYRLLHYTGMAGIGTGRAVTSTQEAVLLLGSQSLYRWLCAILASESPKPLATAWHEVALTRGHLMERMALAACTDPPDALFVLGTFSMLDLLLDMPLDAALALMPLPAATIQALTEKRGPWRPYLDAALALEENDGEALDAACSSLGLPVDSVCEWHTQACTWSAAAVTWTRSGTARAPA